MAGKELLWDLSKVDFDNPMADIEQIRRINPQRYAMEQLTAIAYESMEERVCIGFKDLTHDEFWVSGHMPNMPLMPGVMMLEAAAQVCAYFAQHNDALGAKMIGFGGLERVRFRDPVIPGDRLILICKMVRVRRNRIIVSEFQGVVGDSIVVEGCLKGIPIPVDMLAEQLKDAE